MLTKKRHDEELVHLEDLWKAKMRAKDFEVTELRNTLQDNKSIADGKIQDARQRLTQAEKRIAMRVEQEYATVLEKKD